jgi:hypothetical protein
MRESALVTFVFDGIIYIWALDPREFEEST